MSRLCVLGFFTIYEIRNTRYEKMITTIIFVLVTFILLIIPHELGHFLLAELPAVVVNVMRGGPGLGNIAPSQSDYFQATRGGGHGDYHLVVLAPSSVQEMADLTYLAFDLADKYRNPMMILADAILGQMMEGVKFRNGVKDIPGKKWAIGGARGRDANIIRSLYLQEGVLEEHNRRRTNLYFINDSLFHIKGMKTDHKDH